MEKLSSSNGTVKSVHNSVDKLADLDDKNDDDDEIGNQVDEAIESCDFWWIGQGEDIDHSVLVN